ncbi:probable LRR receptor-like serine/threonine-protein kinase RKF3 isoform X2 [Diospyros lotus]|uniref:probable LRR receptor-like serine/threonine-protein kinase RKF3 isoform X2 n=1 Tax=Diospyros lotus TaxID=55363 RepID=UPI00224EDA07|nr:probable LRR receptor-like serine/threonine-protein kinase RKF3 isoform X2 [Diospyros lotus]
MLHFLVFLFSLQLAVLPSPSSAAAARHLLAENNATGSCPLDFNLLRQVAKGSKRADLDVKTVCQYIRQSLRLVQSEYLRTSDHFFPPLAAAEACWESFQALVKEFVGEFDIRESCGFKTSWMAEGCMNITTREEFEGNVSRAALDDVVSACNQSLENSSPCASCTTSLSSLQASYLTGRSIGNVSDCTAYPSIYAAAFANYFGPTDKVVMGCVLILLVGFAGFLVFRRKKSKKKKKNRKAVRAETSSASGLDSISASTTLVKFTFEEIKKATQNFSRGNMIGRGGFGNVYKGVLADGSEVAMKRFKNCSVSGDTSFVHEVEVIASVRHVNLVALRGYSTATTHLEGHQRIIVCDLMKNGSLDDHLFGLRVKKLSWPIRQKIALGTARGLAYLHCGAQPTILHRDIKASNILLDEKFEPKVADFGLAKFTPEGMTHWSTRVAGTMGYVAPEYALYGQLSERSDVYSFGVVFLELLSGKKALMATNEGQPYHISDWAASLVRGRQALHVIEDDMPDLGPPEVMEKYVVVATLCSHPQIEYRPTMDQIVTILEDMDIAVPCVPDRPIPLIANKDDIERSVSSSGSGSLSTSAGYQPYTFENSHSASPKEGESLGSR